jgi:radical SAM protein with 4Fe4S-binding SPASM domain
MNESKMEADDLLYSPQMVQQQKDKIFLMIDPAAPNWASVNSLGSQILRNCDGRHTLREIAREFSSIPSGQVADFMRQAAKAGFIATSPDLKPAYGGRSKAIAPDRLEELWISTNNECPLRCRHCLVNGGVEQSAPMSTLEIKGLVDQAVKLGAHRTYFTGGEPFLRKALVQLIDYVTQRMQLVVLTSGVLVTPEMAARMKAHSHNNLLVQISLEGPEAATNDAIRGRGSFARAVNGIKTLAAAGLRPIVTTTLTQLNYREAAETTRFLAALGVEDHHILWLHGRGRMRQNLSDLILPGQTVAKVMEELRGAAGGAGITVDNLETMAVRARGRRGRKNDLCNSGYGMLSVNTDGHVYPCAALSGAEGFDCGSLKEISLKEIWMNSAVTQWIRENSVQKRVGCSSCYLKFFCGGGCFAQSYFDYEIKQGSGCIMAADPYCEAYKIMITAAIWEAAMPLPGERDENGPKLYRAMGEQLAACAAGGEKVLDGAFDVGTYHCSCVLAKE